MSKFWKIIKKTFITIKNYYVIIITIVMIIFMILFMQQCRKNQNLGTTSNQNINALTNILRTERNKIGELVFINTGYIAEIDDLKQLNVGLYNEIQTEKQKNYLMYVKLQSLFKQKDTIYLTNIIKEYPKNLFSLNWKYEKDTIGFFQKLIGETSFKVDTVMKDSAMKFKIEDYGTKLTENALGFDVYINARKNDKTGKYEFAAHAKNSNISLNPIGVFDPKIITEKKDNWSVGPSFGFGMSTDYKGQNGQFGWNISFSVQHRFISF